MKPTSEAVQHFPQADTHLHKSVMNLTTNKKSMSEPSYFLSLYVRHPEGKGTNHTVLYEVQGDH